MVETLNAEQNKELLTAMQAANGVERAAIRDRIISGNRGLAVAAAAKMARRMRTKRNAFDDMISEATIGLIRGVDGWRPGMYSLSTYIGVELKRRVARALAIENSPVPIGSAAAKDLANFHHARRRREQSGRPADTETVIAEDVGFGPLRANRVRDILRLREPEKRVRALFVEHEIDFEREDDKREAEWMAGECMARLSERERVVVTLYYGMGAEEPMSDPKIAYRLGTVTHQRIQQIRVRALNKMREHAERLQRCSGLSRKILDREDHPASVRSAA